nr:GDSL esterase/lipase At1g71250 [Ipomoea trifida]
MQQERYTLSQQVVNFESTLNQLRTMMSPSDLNTYLARSIAVVVIGRNAYVNNYLLPFLYTSNFNYNRAQFPDLLLNRYGRQLVVRTSTVRQNYYEMLMHNRFGRQLVVRTSTVRQNYYEML